MISNLIACGLDLDKKQNCSFMLNICFMSTSWAVTLFIFKIWINTLNNKFLIAFDYDGVIADSLEHNLLVAEQACRHLGLIKFPTRNDIEQLENMSFIDIGRQIKVPENQIKDFTDFIFDRLEREPNPLSIFEGIAELLLQL